METRYDPKISGYFRQGFGMVTTHDSSTENCNLFYAEYLGLRVVTDNTNLTKERNFFVDNMVLKKTDSGLYNRRFPEISNEKNQVRTVSQDEILGWLISSKILSTTHGDEIWCQIVTMWGCYNNAGNKWNIMNPANFYCWGLLLNDGKFHWSSLWYPWYFITVLISIMKGAEDTSSKIQYWLEFRFMKSTCFNRILKALYKWRMKSQYGDNWLEVMLQKYHGAEDESFPLNTLLKEVRERGLVVL